MACHNRRREWRPGWFHWIASIAAVLLLLRLSQTDQLVWQALLDRPESAQARFIRSLPRTALEEPRVEQFVRLNSGNWRELCILGPYSNPLRSFDAEFPKARRGWSSWRARIALPFLYFEKGALVVVFTGRDGFVDAFYFDDIFLDRWRQCVFRQES